MGVHELDIRVPPPKALSEEEKIPWEETVQVLNARPSRLKSIPMALKKSGTKNK